MGESARRITERIKDHNGRGHTSHVWNHSIRKSHKNVNTINFKIFVSIFIIINENGKLPKHCGSKT